MPAPPIGPILPCHYSLIVSTSFWVHACEGVPVLRSRGCDTRTPLTCLCPIGRLCTSHTTRRGLTASAQPSLPGVVVRRRRRCRCRCRCAAPRAAAAPASSELFFKAEIAEIWSCVHIQSPKCPRHRRPSRTTPYTSLPSQSFSPPCLAKPIPSSRQSGTKMRHLFRQLSLGSPSSPTPTAAPPCSTLLFPRLTSCVNQAPLLNQQPKPFPSSSAIHFSKFPNHSLPRLQIPFRVMPAASAVP